MKKCTLFSLTSFVSSALLVVALLLLTSGIASAATFSPTPHASHTTKVLSRIIIIPRPSRLQRVSSQPPSPFASTSQCLLDDVSAVSPSDNVADSLAETTNNCPATVGGTQTMNITTSCPGLGSGGGTTFNFSKFSGGVVDNSLEIDAGCVSCEYVNGVHTGETFPEFALGINLKSKGTYFFRNVLFNTTSNGSSTGVDLSNSGKFAPPCPPTE